MSVLDALPPRATTGVGSLPFGDVGVAARHAARAYELPFCPQLPRLEGDMTAEWLGGDPRRCGWSPERDRERPRAWDALLAELRLRPPAHRLVKLQVTGPLTLAMALEGGGPSARGHFALCAELGVWLAANVAASARALSRLDLRAVVVVDEPCLAAVGANAPVAAWEPLRAAAPAWGLHACCDVPWDVIERAEPDLVSLDVSGGILPAPAAGGVRRLLDRGGRVAWGLTAVASRGWADEPAAAEARLRRLEAQVADDGSRSLLTPACGSGLVTVERERALAAGLAEVRARAAGWHEELAA